MAYRDDVIALSPDHYWPFENGNDLITTNPSTGTAAGGAAFDGAAITEDASGSVRTNGVGERLSFTSRATLENSSQTRRAVGGWFQVSAVNQPFARIFGDGDNINNYQFVLGMGNRVKLEIRSGSTWQVQVYSDIALVPGRTYHLFMTFEGSGFRNEVNFYIDGVLQTNAIPVDRRPDSASLASRSGGVTQLGDPAATVGLDGTALVMVAPVNGLFAHWASWANKTLPTAAEIRATLFEGGALPEFTITTATQTLMQVQLDTIANTLRPDAAVSIRVEPVAGGGDFALTADNVTFSESASVHVQYTGTDVLTWTNTNGANASIGSTPNGGTLDLVEAVPMIVSTKEVAAGFPAVPGSRVRLFAAVGGPAPVDTLILTGTTDAAGELTANYNYQGDQPVSGWARQGSGPFYKQGALGGTITLAGLDIVALLVDDS